MSSSSSSKSVLLWTTCCVFGGGNIVGSTVRKVPHLAMCGDFTLFMGCNIFVGCSSSLSFQQNWSHLIWSSFAKVIAVFVSVFCWFGLLGPDIPLYRNFRFPSSSKKTAKERRKRVLTPVGNCARKFPSTGISECTQKALQFWLRKEGLLVLTRTGNCARKFPSTGIFECPQKSPPEMAKEKFGLLLTPAGISARKFHGLGISG